MLPSKRPLYMGNILNVAPKIGNINLPTLIIIYGPWTTDNIQINRHSVLFKKDCNGGQKIVICAYYGGFTACIYL